MRGPVLVVGYGWRDGEPRLRLRAPEGLGEHVLSGDLDLYVTGLRRCIGHRDEGLVPCPDDAEPVGRQCQACRLRDRSRPCMTCDGFRCPPLDARARARCRDTHHLYLACFGHEQLKVGTAVDGRREARVVEQGPLAAARVAAGEGPRVKQMEHLLAGSGFTEALRRSRKTRLLSASMTRAEAEERVIAAARALPDLLPERYHGLLHEPVLVEQPELARRSRAYAVQPMPVAPGTVLRGEVVGAVGHVLFVRDDDGVFAVDLGELVTRVVEIGGGRPAPRPTVQLGLFA